MRQIEFAFDGILRKLKNSDGSEMSLERIKQIRISYAGLVFQDGSARNAVNVIRVVARHTWPSLR